MKLHVVEPYSIITVAPETPESVTKAYMPFTIVTSLQEELHGYFEVWLQNGKLRIKTGIERDTLKLSLLQGCSQSLQKALVETDLSVRLSFTVAMPFEGNYEHISLTFDCFPNDHRNPQKIVTVNSWLLNESDSPSYVTINPEKFALYSQGREIDANTSATYTLGKISTFTAQATGLLQYVECKPGESITGLHLEDTSYRLA